MNSPRRIGEVVHRLRTPSTETIHRLLSHVRSKGLDWVPEPLGLSDTHERLSFLKGDVPHDMPGWIWEEQVLCQVAGKMRQWHDATVDFDDHDAHWGMETKSPPEVVCHNDFAPYNCVFAQRNMVGLIDFDLCAPGSRLWDMAYTAYRYVPVMPAKHESDFAEHSLFGLGQVLVRLDLFLDAYAQGQSEFRYSREELLKAMSQRLQAIATWTRRYSQETSNATLARNADMYENHAGWIAAFLDSCQVV